MGRSGHRFGVRGLDHRVRRAGAFRRCCRATFRGQRGALCAVVQRPVGLRLCAAGIGIFLCKAWATALAPALAVAILALFAFFGLRVLRGDAYEARTVGAMGLRAAVWIGIAIWLTAVMLQPASGCAWLFLNRSRGGKGRSGIVRLRAAAPSRSSYGLWRIDQKKAPRPGRPRAIDTGIRNR